ncbi:GntR family transcriptional regulator [Niabella sp. 22666]|uniref:GntR family transcriptional regulator n=1 Tax=Niabella sp. 22666 TaxID=3453954 RepID=UPI003F84BA13
MQREEKHKFKKISDEIIRAIQTGKYLPGEKIPSENEIISQYNVSNTTARKVLLAIELNGLARRIKGKGTFVLNRTEDRHLVRTLGSIADTRIGFNEKLKAEGFEPKNIILEKTILNDGISSEINGKHYIIQGPVLKVHQLRYANDLIMKDETKYISLTLCPKINLLPPEASHYKAYETKYQLGKLHIIQTMGADIFKPDDERNNFGTAAIIPVFVLDSAIFTLQEKVVELERSYYRGDKYRFAINAQEY